VRKRLQEVIDVIGLLGAEELEEALTGKRTGKGPGND